MSKTINYIRGKHNVIFRAFAFLITVLVIMAVFPKQGKFKYEYQLGKQWLNDDLTAPFDFPILKSKTELQSEQNKIKSEAKLYAKIDTGIVTTKLAEVKQDINKKWKKESPYDKEKTIKFISDALKKIYNIGVLEKSGELEEKQSDEDIGIVRGQQTYDTPINKLFTLQTAYDYLNDTLKKSNNLIDKALLAPLAENFITHNVFYDDDLTEKFLEEQLTGISPTRDLMKSGSRIITKGEIVDKDKYQILESLKNEFLTQHASKTNRYWINIGFSILIAVCFSLLFTFLFLFRRDILEDNVKIAFMLFVVTVNIVMVSLAIKIDVVNIYLLPFGILPVIMRVFYDTRIALFTQLVSCLLAGFIVSNPFEFMMLELTSGMVAIFSIINMRNRAQLFISVAFIYLSLCLTYFGIHIIQEGKPEEIDLTYFGWFAVSSMITLFSYPLIYIFEKLFGFVSDVTLLELADTNSPLLRELALKAPGTFQHSLQVATLAEDAVRQIGGSPLLIRTGALYHDIGKIEAPLYFIENQAGSVNPHVDLNADESAHVIIDHVIKGIEKARKNNLPEQIIDFIRTHHGTLKVQYFYRTFILQNPDEKVDMNLFQYPGPIPFSKETAVLMMADSVEAASRSLKKYDADSISDLVDKIINHQIEENQFVNSDITFKDINIIRKMFKKKLINIYHLRIEYPA
ncbi:MAG: HDIG domain-containing protein [Bacteroidia bacterium]|nr:HDIG domain-containing protein [Bacteroidia bacterium]